MSIFREYVKGDISNNRKSYNSTRITIFLAVLILCTFVVGIFSYFKSFLDTPGDAMGGSQFRIISPISSKDANDLASNRHIDKIGFFNIKELEEGFGSKDQTKLYKMDDNAIATRRDTLKKGKLPKEKEVMISDDMSREIEKGIGDRIEIEASTYSVSGIYYDTNHEYMKTYNIYTRVNQETLLNSKEELSPFIWYENIYRTYSLSKEILGNLEETDAVYGYNDLYLNRSFVFDPDKNLLKDYSNHVLIFLVFTILIILFYSILVNLFLVQESKSIVEYSKLKSMGATSKDISKIIRLKAMYISQVPIATGVVVSLALVKLLFSIIKKVDNYFSNGEDIYSVYMHLNLKFDFRIVLFVYLLSLLIIYVSTKNPIRKLKKNTILDGLKGNVKGKSYKKHDLRYTGDIEKDLSKQFYKNSKYNFRFTGMTLKMGFLLMIFIMMAFTYYSMDKEFNHISKYENYDIQAEYETLNPLNQDLMKKIKGLETKNLVNFRKESTYLVFDQGLVSGEYKDKGSLSGLEEKITSFDNMQVEIFGIEDEKFNELALSKGLDPSLYVGNKVILLNTMEDNFSTSVSEMKNIEFLKDNIEEISLTEYPDNMGFTSKGHEFTLNVEEKIEEPLFDYPTLVGGLNVYMSKSQYIELFNKFLRIGDLDQREYISIKTDNIEAVEESMVKVSQEYFKEKDYSVESRFHEENLVKKRNVIGSVLAIFLSMFFLVVGFSNCYFSFYNLFLKRKDELSLYKAIGMDEGLLANIFKREKRKILFSFIYSMPIIILVAAFIVAKISRIFTLVDILSNLNSLFIFVILGYILIIYVSVSKIYDKYTKDII